MNGAVGEWSRERLVHAPMLLHQREADERRRRHDHLKMVASAGTVDHIELGRVRKRALEQLAERLCAHASIVASASWSPGRTPAAAPSPSSITTFAPRRDAMRQGRNDGTTSSTTSSRSQNTASMVKRMKNMWIEPAGRNSIASPGASDERPSKPRRRDHGWIAR